MKNQLRCGVQYLNESPRVASALDNTIPEPPDFADAVRKHHGDDAPAPLPAYTPPANDPTKPRDWLDVIKERRTKS